MIDPPLFCRYETVYPDLYTSFPEIFEFLGCVYQKEKLSALNPLNTKSRFNMGRIGRGVELLTASQKRRAKNIIGIYGPEAEDLIHW